MSIEVMELFDIFSGTFGKEKAQLVVKDIEALISDHKRELAAKDDVREVRDDVREVRDDVREVRSDIQKVDTRLSETELKLTKEIESVKLEIEKVRSEIEQAKTSTVKWVVGWVAGLLIAYTGAIFTLLMLFKK
ncbi:MAG: hypothetical protein AB1611_20665 [bacterium]